MRNECIFEKNNKTLVNEILKTMRDFLLQIDILSPKGITIAIYYTRDVGKEVKLFYRGVKIFYRGVKKFYRRVKSIYRLQFEARAKRVL